MKESPREWTVLSMLEWGTEFFKNKSVPDPRLSIEWLLAEVLDVNRLDLYLKFDRPLSPDELEQLRPLVKRRARHEPLQYITGYTEFMHARLKVTPDVLIPRIETEQLVEIILDRHPEDTQCTVLDIGTGSGCIPVALKMERPDWEVTSFDISEEALNVARENAELNQVEIRFLQGNLLHPDDLQIEPGYDIIVSNPPYVLRDEKDKLQKQVVDYEPGTALYADDLESIYKNIIRVAEQYLAENGRLYVEIHESHADEILELFDSHQWSAHHYKDYQEKDRFILAQKSR